MNERVVGEQRASGEGSPEETGAPPSVGLGRTTKLLLLGALLLVSAAFGAMFAFADSPPSPCNYGGYSYSGYSGYCPTGTGSISGRVTQAGTDAPIMGVAVTITDRVSGYSWTQYTDGDGAYYKGSLPQSTYDVRANRSGHEQRWYADATTAEDATPIELNENEILADVDLTLPVSGATITGTVTDAVTGDPVEGACIQPTLVYVGSGGSSPSFGGPSTPSCFGALTGPTGQYAIGGLLVNPDYRYVLLLTDPQRRYVSEWYDGQATSVTATRLAPTTTANFSADLGGTLSGTLRDASTADPVAGRLLNFYGAADPNTVVAQTVSLGDGTYRSPALAAGSYLVRALPSGDSTYLESWYDGASSAAGATPVTVTVGSDEPGVDFDLVAGGRVQGSVIDEETGNPVFALVQLYDAATGAALGNPIYSSGTFQTRALAPGTYKLGVSNACCFLGQYRLEYFDDAATLEAATPISIVGSETVSGIVLDLVPLPQIEGTVTDAQTGLPVQGVSITAYPTGGWGIPGGSGYSGPDGSYAIPAAEGSYVLFVQDSLGRYLTEWFENQPDSSTAAVLNLGDSDIVADIEVDAGATISGTLTDADTGDPIANREVAFREAGSLNWIGSVFTNPSGEYQSPPLTDGDYLVQSLPSGDTEYLGLWYDQVDNYGDATPVPIAGGASVSEVDFHLTRSALTGRVVDQESGEGIEMAQVELFTSELSFVGSTSTSADGSFSFGAPPGDYVFHAGGGAPVAYAWEYYEDTPHDYDATPVTFDEFYEPITIELGGATLTGIATDSATGDPVADACLVVEELPTFGSGFWTQACTDADGIYGVRVPAGSYRLRVYDGATHLGGTFDNGGLGYEVLAGDTTVVDLSLDRGAQVTGVVTDELTGEPVPGVSVFVAPSDGGSTYGNGITDSDGSYITTALPTGNYTVRFYDNGGRFVEEWYDNSPNPEGALDLNLVQGTVTNDIDAALASSAGTLSGVVVDDVTGDPVSGACATVIDPATSGVVAVGCGGADGAYSVSGVRSGDWIIRFDAPGYASEFFDDVPDQGSALPVTFAPAAGVELDAALTNLPEGVAGVVSDIDTEDPLSSICAYLYDGYLGNYLGSAYCTDGDGQYTFLGLDPGTYWVAVSDPAGVFESLWQPVTVVQGEVQQLDFALSAVPPPGGISGTVSGADTGLPTDGVCAYLYDGFNGNYLGSAYCTGPDGAYAFAGLEPAQYWVAIADPTATYSTAWSAVVVEAGGTSELDVELSVVPDPGSITGVVTHGGGFVTVQGVCAYLYDGLEGNFLGSAYCTDVYGAYSFIGLEPGTYWVAVSDPNGVFETEWSSVSVLANTEAVLNFDLQQVQTNSISGFVGWRADGPEEPLESLEGVCAYLYDGYLGDYLGTAYCTGASGEFAFAPVDPGTYWVAVSDPDGQFVTSWNEVTVVSGPYELTVEMDPVPPVGIIQGVVTDDGSGDPVSGVCAYLYDGYLGNYLGSAYCTGADGHYAFLDVPAGDYWVAVSDPLGRYESSWQYILIEGMPSSPLDVQLVGIGSITGVVESDGGSPLADVIVYLNRADGSYSGFYGVTDASGTFTIVGIPAGGYRAGFYPPGYFAEGETTTIWFDGATDEAGATEITVLPGGVTTGIDAVVGALVSL